MQTTRLLARISLMQIDCESVWHPAFSSDESSSLRAILQVPNTTYVDTLVGANQFDSNVFHACLPDSRTSSSELFAGENF